MTFILSWLPRNRLEIFHVKFWAIDASIKDLKTVGLQAKVSKKVCYRTIQKHRLHNLLAHCTYTGGSHQDATPMFKKLRYKYRNDSAE